MGASVAPRFANTRCVTSNGSDSRTSYPATFIVERISPACSAWPTRRKAPARRPAMAECPPSSRGKSRPRKSGDSGLVETKCGAIVRKHVGWGHIAPTHAAPINQFYTPFLNPYVNYHRPSAQAEVQIDAKGRKRRLYKQWQTPFEKLLSLDRPLQFLRPGLSIRRAQTRGRIHQRHRGSATYATGQKHHVRADKKIGMSPGQQWKWTVEMTAYGKPGKR